MRAGTGPTLFEQLDECHRQIGARLKPLAEVARQVQANGLTGDVRQQAADIEAFFSTVSREHHEQEERSAFPPLLAIGDPALAETVQTLQQEHGWIEARWPGLAARLRAIASGHVSFDPQAFVADVREFVEVLKAHMELEDTVIYPQSRLHWSRAVATRMSRETAAPS